MRKEKQQKSIFTLALLSIYNVIQDFNKLDNVAPNIWVRNTTKNFYVY